MADDTQFNPTGTHLNTEAQRGREERVLLEEKVFTVDYSKGTQKRKKELVGGKNDQSYLLSLFLLGYPMRKKKGRREFFLPLFAPSFHHSRRVSLSAAFGWKRESHTVWADLRKWKFSLDQQPILSKMRTGYRETDESSLKRHSPDYSLFHISRPIAIVYEFEMSGKCFSLNRRHIFIPTGSTDLLP